MKFHPDVTSYRAIAKGAGVTRHTAAKWYEMMRECWGGRRKMWKRLVSHFDTSLFL